MNFKKLLKLFEAGDSEINRPSVYTGNEGPGNPPKGTKFPKTYFSGNPKKDRADYYYVDKNKVGYDQYGNPSFPQAKTKSAIKPNPNPNQDIVDAGNRTRNAQQAVLRGEEPTDRFAGQAATDAASGEDHLRPPKPDGQGAPAIEPETTVSKPPVEAKPDYTVEPSPAAAAVPSSGTVVRSSDGRQVSTGSGDALKTRSDAEIAADMKNPYAKYTNPAGQKSFKSVGDWVNAIKGKPAPTTQAPAAAAPAAAAIASSSKPANVTTNPVPSPEVEINPTTAPVPAPDVDTKTISTGPRVGQYGKFTEEEEELENALNEMMRLSGLPLNEKAVSKQQQKFMGMVHAMQKGEKVKGASSELKKAAKGMTKKAAKDFASTKHKGLPKRVDEAELDIPDTEGKSEKERHSAIMKKYPNAKKVGKTPGGYSTKGKGKPDLVSGIKGVRKIKEGVELIDETRETLKHIANRFKYETKMFMQSGHMDADLFHALYDYYLDKGEMPYSVAKGDPQPWVEEHFYQDMGSGMSESSHDLTELARLAGLSESKIEECGMGMPEQQDSMNVSTNMNSNGTKNVTISAEGDKADSLLQMLKLAGMKHDHHEEPVAIISTDNEEMIDEGSSQRLIKKLGDASAGAKIYKDYDWNEFIVKFFKDGRMLPEESWHHTDDLEDAVGTAEIEIRRMSSAIEEEYANEPEEEYETVNAITRQGNDLNREKRQYADKPKLGDNPMAESILDSELEEMLESIKIKEAGVLDAEKPYRDPKTGKMVTPPKGATMPPPDSEFPPGDRRNLAPSLKKTPAAPKMPAAPSAPNVPTIPKGMNIEPDDGILNLPPNQRGVK